MLVRVLNFGCNWWARFGSDPADPHRYASHAAYYNSTGVRCSRKVRRHWVVPGLIRFNPVGGFNPHLPTRSLGHTFLASDLDFMFGGNRLLLKRKMPDSASPDCFLVVVSQDIHGRMNFATSAWKSNSAGVIAASQLRQTQEAMLLMKPGDWVRTACGFWQLNVTKTRGLDARLELETGESLAQW
jgi:hypothetical protein